MNLWIRSQNQTILINVKNILIDITKKDIYTVEQLSSALHTVKLGTYKSKKRALEVLDEIEGFITQPTKYESRYSYTSGTDMFSRRIYQMPQK